MSQVYHHPHSEFSFMWNVAGFNVHNLLIRLTIVHLFTKFTKCILIYSRAAQIKALRHACMHFSLQVVAISTSIVRKNITLMQASLYEIVKMVYVRHSPDHKHSALP